MSIPSILLLLAFVCFVLSALGVGSRVNLQSLGLALWVLGMFIG